MVGTDDQITMQGNYISHTAGRSPALSGGTLLHAVNNVWEDNNGHALEGGDTKARGIYEGNVFINIKSMVDNYAGRLFTADDQGSNSACKPALGRSCVSNIIENSKGNFSFKDDSFFSEFSGLEIASAVPAAQAQLDVPKNAGAGKIDAMAEKPAEKSNPSPVSRTVSRYGQCGGNGYTGATVCAYGKCIKQNDWYSQCL